MSWALFFPDYPTMGVAFRRLIHLMREALLADTSHLRPFTDGIALACGTPPNGRPPLSVPGGSECRTPNLRWRAPPRPGRGPGGHLRHG